MLLGSHIVRFLLVVRSADLQKMRLSQQAVLCLVVWWFCRFCLTQYNTRNLPRPAALTCIALQWSAAYRYDDDDDGDARMQTWLDAGLPEGTTRSPADMTTSATTEVSVRTSPRPVTRLRKTSRQGFTKLLKPFPSLQGYPSVSAWHHRRLRGVPSFS